jgi:hypothetical protein
MTKSKNLSLKWMKFGVRVCSKMLNKNKKRYFENHRVWEVSLKKNDFSLIEKTLLYD